MLQPGCSFSYTNYRSGGSAQSCYLNKIMCMQALYIQCPVGISLISR